MNKSNNVVMHNYQFLWKQKHKRTKYYPDTHSLIVNWFYRPAIPEEEVEEEAIGDDDAEVTVNKVDEEMIVRIFYTCMVVKFPQNNLSSMLALEERFQTLCIV